MNCEFEISEKISYIKAGNEPLSADIGIIRTDSAIWLYDVGNDIRKLPKLGKKCNVILSHFHDDHTGSLAFVDFDKAYMGKLTYEYLIKKNAFIKTLSQNEPGRLIVISDHNVHVDGLNIFPIPSSHAKGCLGLKVDDYAFMGDALYSKADATHFIYNSQLLLSEINVLKSLSASKLLVSHYPGLIRDRLEVIKELENYYGMRDKNTSEIRIKR